jgi:hypothetical protein
MALVVRGVAMSATLHDGPFLLAAQIICHGIPDQYELQDGDICNIDVTAFYDGMHGDLNETVFVGYGKGWGGRC